MATITEALQHISAIVDRYSGVQDITLGAARQVCNLPWVAEFAFLHRLNPAASIEQIASVAALTGRQPHRDFKTFLASHNGFDLFNGSLSIYGVRAHWDRTAPDVLWLPFDLGLEGLLLNTMIGRDDMVIGSLGPEVHRLVMRADGSIDRTDREDAVVLESWPNLADMLIVETERFSRCYETDGRMRSHYIVEEGKTPPWRTDPLLTEAELRPFSKFIYRLSRLLR